MNKGADLLLSEESSQARIAKKCGFKCWSPAAGPKNMKKMKQRIAWQSFDNKCVNVPHDKLALHVKNNYLKQLTCVSSKQKLQDSLTIRHLSSKRQHQKILRLQSLWEPLSTSKLRLEQTIATQNWKTWKYHSSANGKVMDLYQARQAWRGHFLDQAGNSNYSSSKKENGIIKNEYCVPPKKLLKRFNKVD